MERVGVSKMIFKTTETTKSILQFLGAKQIDSSGKKTFVLTGTNWSSACFQNYFFTYFLASLYALLAVHKKQKLIGLEHTSYFTFLLTKSINVNNWLSRLKGVLKLIFRDRLISTLHFWWHHILDKRRQCSQVCSTNIMYYFLSIHTAVRFVHNCLDAENLWTKYAWMTYNKSFF